MDGKIYFALNMSPTFFSCHIIPRFITSLSTRAVIGQKAGRALLYRPLKFKIDSVAKLFFDLSPTVFNFYSK